MSSRKGKRQPVQPPYLTPNSRLPLVKISEFSYFCDEVWRFDSDLAGRRALSVNWRLHVPPDTWADPRFQNLLLDAKRLFFAIIFEDNPRPGSISEFGPRLRTLIIWMYNRSYWTFASLNGASLEEYYGHICGQFLDDDVITVTNDTIEKYVGSFYLLANKRAAFEAIPRIQVGAGVTHWLSTRGSNVRKGTKPLGKIPALPDEVFNPLMQQAITWVDVYSKDILELQNIEMEAYGRTISWKSKNYTSYINRQLVGYKFTRHGPQPWRPDIAPQEWRETQDESGLHKVVVKPVRLLRHLVVDLIASCSIVILGFIGMRVSELLGLLVSSELKAGLPSCVTVRTSTDGVYDVFYIRGRIYKGEKLRGKQEGEWVAGVRPVGSTYLPEAIRALVVLFRLTSHWRSLYESEDLFIYPTSANGLPRNRAGLAPIVSERLAIIQRAFLQKCGGVAARYSDWRLTTHQFRKKFAQDIVRCDSEAPAAVREHFKHVSMLVLDGAYLWTDGDLKQTIDDLAVRDAAAEIMDIIDDVRPVAGRMPELIKKASPELQRLAPKSLPKEGRLDRLSNLAKTEGLRAWPCQFGTCVFRSETARCHFAGSGAYDFTADRPLASERCADRCAECFNLSISQRHKDFWITRYRENRMVWNKCREDNTVSWALLARRRMDRAASVLAKLQIDVEEIEIAV